MGQETRGCDFLMQERTCGEGEEGCCCCQEEKDKGLLHHRSSGAGRRMDGRRYG